MSLAEMHFLSREEKDLVGFWSVDAQYAAGAQGDEWLFFFPDGTGRFDFLNWGWCSSNLFDWKVKGGDLVIKGSKSYKLANLPDAFKKHIAVEHDDLMNLKAPYSIAAERTPRHEWLKSPPDEKMRILRIQRPDDMFLPSSFGFVRQDIEDRKHPDYLNHILPRWKSLKLRDRIRIVSLPEQPLDAAGTIILKRLIKSRGVREIDWIDDKQGYPWFTYMLRRRGKIESHSIAICDEKSWVRVKSRKKAAV